MTEILSSDPLITNVETKSLGDKENRLDVMFYYPKYLDALRALSRCPWKVKELGELATLKGGATPRGAQYLDEGILFFRIQNIGENELILHGIAHIDNETHNRLLKRSQLKENDIIMTITGRVGTSTVYSLKKEANINQHNVRIRLKTKGLNPYYVSIFLNSKYGRFQTERLAYGTTRTALEYSSIRKIKIPVPPNEIQNRIVKLMRITHEKQKLKLQERKKLLNNISDFVLKKLGIKIPEVEDKRTYWEELESNLETRTDPIFYHPKHTSVMDILESRSDTKLLGEVIKQIKYGASVENDYVEEEKGIPFLRIQDFRDGEIDLGNLKYLNPELERKIGNGYVKEGDILISRSGTVGVVVCVPKEADGFAFGSYIIKFNLTQGINPEYVSIFLNTEAGRLQIERFVTGAVQTNITIPAIKSMRIPVPSIEVQNKIVKETKRNRKEAKKLRKEADEVVKKVKKEVEKSIGSG